MEAEDVINLLDTSWFYQKIFKKSSERPTSSILKRIQYHQIQENSSEPKISSQLTINTRSNSEQMMSPKSSSLYSGSFSPNSVLPGLHLESILSGVGGKPEFPGTETRKVETGEKKKKKKIRKKGMNGLSKSLSALEFEELKGFMDLGFVFSEEDKRDSTLVEMIPGLQRLGQAKTGHEEKNSSGQEEPSITITRPYLSEAWEDLDRRKKMKPLMNWKFPSVSDEIGMKDNLKWWAHAVASTVR